MPPILTFAAGRAALDRATEENGAEFLLALGRAGGGEERNDARIAWTIGGSPVANHNAIVRADLDPAEADAVIAEAIARLRARRLAGTWHLGPSMRPADLGERLVAHNFTFGGDEPSMAADLAAPIADDTPAGLTVARVRGEADLAAWVATLAAGFGEGPHEAEWAGAMYRKPGLGDAGPWRLYLGRVGDKPVATASAYFAAGVAGIYFIFTVEEMRRRGIGAAITRAAMRDAQAAGYRVAVLGSSPLGQSVYARLGFIECGAIAIYEWKP